MAIEQRKSQLVFTADTSQFKQGVSEAKDELKKLSGTAQAESEKMSKTFKDIPEGMSAGVTASERQIRSMISAIQRAEAEAGAVSNRASDRLANLAKIRNIPTEAIEPYLRSLRSTEDQQAKVAAGMNNMGLSAKQMQASLRGLPAQFTDIFTSLATGQAPITVLLQQGGQIKDMFGGIVPALKAMGGAIAAMITPWTVLAAAVGVVGYAISQGAKEQREFEKQLILTGNAVGTTSTKLMSAAAAYSEFGVTQGKMAESMLQMMGSVRTGADDVARFTKAAIEMEKYGGTAFKETAKAFKELGEEPLKASLKYNEGMNYLSIATYEYIKLLEKQGRTQEAAKVAQEEYFKATKERADALKANLGYLEIGWNAIADTAKKAWDMMVGLGRSRDPLQEINAKIADRQRALVLTEGKPHVLSDAARQRIIKELEDLRDQQRNAQEVDRMQQRLSGYESARTRQIEAREEVEKRLRDTEENSEKRQRMILEVKNLIVAAGYKGVEAAQLEAKLVAQINEKYKDRGKQSTGSEANAEFMKDWAKIIEDWQKIAIDSSAAVDELTKSEKDLLKVVGDPRWEGQTQAFKDATFAIFNQAQAEEELAKRKKENDKSWKENEKQAHDSAEAVMKETKAIEDQVEKLRLHTAQLGLTEQAKKALTIADRNREIQRLRTLLQDDAEMARDPAERDRIEARIRALEKLSEAERQAGEAGDLYKLQKEWDKTAESIESSLTDALMHGFEAGKEYGKNVADALKASFKTFTAKLIIEPVMKGAIGGMMSSIGLGTQAGNSTNMGMLGNLFSLGGGTGSSGILSSLSGTDLGAILGAGAGGMYGSSALYGAAIGSSSIGAGSQAAMLASQTGVFGQAGLSATASSAGAGAGAGAASAIPVIGWIALAAYIGYSLFASNRARHRQAQQNYGYLGMDDPFSAHSPNRFSTDLYNPMLYPVQGMVNQYASMFGGDSSGIGYGLFSSASPDGRGAQTISTVRRNGLQLYGSNVNADNASMEARLKAEIPRMMLAGLQASDLSKHYKEFFDKFDATRMTEDTLNTIVEIASSAYQMAEAFKQLGGPFQQLVDLSVEARAGVLDLVGGLDQFMGKTGNYFQNYYSDSEKQALSLASVDKTLTGAGLDPDLLRTREDFRKMVESLDVSTPEGQRKFAALMNSADAFNFGVALLEATGKTLGQITAGAPETAGVDLMISTQQTTNSLLEKIEAAIRETGVQTVQAIQEIVINTGDSYISGSGTEVSSYGGVTGGGN